MLGPPVLRCPWIGVGVRETVPLLEGDFQWRCSKCDPWHAAVVPSTTAATVKQCIFLRCCLRLLAMVNHPDTTLGL